MHDPEQDIWSWGITYTPDGSWVLIDEPQMGSTGAVSADV
jgi:hypothetical protein